MATRTLTLLRTDVRNKADAPSANFPTDAELTRDINLSAKKLYDLILDAGGQEQYLTSATIPLVAGTAAYTLPNGTLYSSAPEFYRAFGVDIDIGGPTLVALRPFQFAERNKYVRGGWNPEVAQYRIQGSQIRFIPTPTVARNVTLWYAPVLTALSDDGDTLDGFNGFEEFVVLDVAIKYCHKARLQSMGFAAQLQAETERIRAAVAKRDQGFPEVVTDVEGIGIDPYWRWL